jgi:preprotein translocase SecE subunit
MSYGIYKPGQGYWTRVLTAIGAGTIALGAAAWLWREVQNVETSFEIIYLQFIVASIVIVAASLFIYWLIGLSRRPCEFLIATEGEMRKVNWSTRREIIGSTWVVVGVSVILAVILFLVDIGFAFIAKAAGLIQT